MVFAINPTAEKTFDKFREVAIAINGTAPTAPPAPEKTPEALPTLTLTPDAPTAAPEVPEKDKEVPAPPKDIEAPYTAPGWNEMGDPKACNCACFCGVGSFPQGDGWGAYGGVGGALSSPW